MGWALALGEFFSKTHKLMLGWYEIYLWHKIYFREIFYSLTLPVMIRVGLWVDFYQNLTNSR
jgi:hypothetical protein